MTSIDVKGPIKVHLNRALSRLDALIDELEHPDPMERAAVLAERARRADPAYQFGVMLGQMNRALIEMAERMAAGFQAGKAR